MSLGYDAEVFLRKYFESNNVICRLFVNKATADRDKLLQPDIIMGWVGMSAESAYCVTASDSFC